MSTLRKKKSNSTTKKENALPNRPGPQTVCIEFSDSEGVSVTIAGTFNDWRPEATPMMAVGPGRWVKHLALLPGTYEYCLIVDGCRWVADPQARETAPNPYGGRNTIRRVSETKAPSRFSSESCNSMRKEHSCGMQPRYD